MTFEAYINNIHAKTGKRPKDFFDEAVRQQVLRPDTKTMEFVNWLKAHSGLAVTQWQCGGRFGATVGSRWRRRPYQTRLGPTRRTQAPRKPRND